MKSTLTSFTVLFFLAMNSYSQEKPITIHGKIHSGDTLVANVHIYNISKKVGTISNDLGEFKLNVNTSDTLYISSLEYKKISVIVTKNNISAQFLSIELFPLVNELDEIFLRHLTGSLSVDMANKPKDTIPKHNFKFNKSDLDKNLPKDNYALGSPIKNYSVDPLGPIGGGATLPDYAYEKEQRLKREIAQKKGFPDEIKSEFGIEYFTKTLKIPEDKINHFLSYCEYQNIIEKYYNNKVLEVIEILNEESKNYHAIEN